MLRLCGQIANRKALDGLEMSSTLFGRGTNTQVGGKRRAEEQERSVLAVRTAVDELRSVSASSADLRAATLRVTTLEATVAALQATVATLQKSVAAANETAATTS